MALRTDIRFVAISRSRDTEIVSQERDIEVVYNTQKYTSERLMHDMSVISPLRDMTVNKIRKIVA